MEISEKECGNDYIAVKAEAFGVQVIGMTRGTDTRPHHTEAMEKGEVLIMQFTDKTSLIKIKGNAKVYTKFGVIESEKTIK